MNSNNQHNDQQQSPHRIEPYKHRQPTIKQLKGICECYSHLNGLVRKNSTRKELLKILYDVRPFTTSLIIYCRMYF